MGVRITPTKLSEGKTQSKMRGQMLRNISKVLRKTNSNEKEI